MVFISAICHGQWYLGPLGPRWYFTSYMSYVLQNYDFFFIFMFLNQLSISFLLKMMLDFSTFAKHIE